MIVTEWTRGKSQQDLLPDKRREIDIVRAVKTHPHILRAYFTILD